MKINIDIDSLSGSLEFLSETPSIGVQLENLLKKINLKMSVQTIKMESLIRKFEPILTRMNTYYKKSEKELEIDVLIEGTNVKSSILIYIYPPDGSDFIRICGKEGNPPSWQPNELADCLSILSQDLEFVNEENGKGYFLKELKN